VSRKIDIPGEAFGEDWNKAENANGCEFPSSVGSGRSTGETDEAEAEYVNCGTWISDGATPEQVTGRKVNFQ